MGVVVFHLYFHLYESIVYLRSEPFVVAMATLTKENLRRIIGAKE